jgi:hypothetical protein
MSGENITAAIEKQEVHKLIKEQGNPTSLIPPQDHLWWQYVIAVQKKQR